MMAIAKCALEYCRVTMIKRKMVLRALSVHHVFQILIPEQCVFF